MALALKATAVTFARSIAGAAGIPPPARAAPWQGRRAIHVSTCGVAMPPDEQGDASGGGAVAPPGTGCPDGAAALAAAGRSVYFETYGCQMNVSDLEVVLAILRAAG